MPRFYEPDLGSEPDSPFARDANKKPIRRSYWLDMNDRSLVLAMTQGLGANLTNDEKHAHLAGLKREHLMRHDEKGTPVKWHFCNASQSLCGSF